MFYLISFSFFVFSILFLFFPDVLIKLSEWGNKLILTDHKAVIHRKVVGIMLFSLSVIVLFVSWQY